MQTKKTFAQYREVLLTLVPAAVLVLGAFWATAKVMQPAAPKKLTIATASKGSPYHAIAERYQKFLARNGVTLEIRETSGSFENLKLVKDETSGVQVAFLQGGVGNGTEAPQLLSIGRVMYEPLWIFHRKGVNIATLSDLAGKRVLVGPDGGGTNLVAKRLLAANGVTPDNATLVNMELPDYVDALSSAKADVGFLVLAASARTVQRLFHNSDVALLDLAQADAYAQRFPFLTKLDLKRGIVDLGRDIPASDHALVSTIAAVVVHESLHPALANLLTQALIDVHNQPTVDKSGEAPIFQRSGEFPIQTDSEFVLSDDAKRVYRSGPPFLQRFLPFWLATLVDRFTVLALPVLGILLPVVRFAPAIYTWRIRRRILFWYEELKKVEAGFGGNEPGHDFATAQARIEEIEEAVNHIPVPIEFANQLYDLRQHIDVVRRWLASLQPSH